MLERVLEFIIRKSPSEKALDFTVTILFIIFMGLFIGSIFLLAKMTS